MKELLIGTTNIAKFNDYKELLKDSNLELVSLHQKNIPEPEETGKDFEENAILKAKYYFEKTGLPTLADDGGFEIEALNWEPGVLSHRWLGKKTSDEKLIAEVVKRMKDKDNRNCRMRAVIAIASPVGVYTAEGRIEGVVADEPSKKRIEGFPYRSVMFFPNYKKYFCELSANELEILNHRKVAIEKIKDILQEIAN